MSSENPFWDVIQNYLDDPSHRYRPTAADLARETGISEQLLSKWKRRPVLPEAAHLLAFAQGTGIGYGDLLEAALQGRKYLTPGSRVVIRRGTDRLLAESEVVRDFRRRLQTDDHLLSEDDERLEPAADDVIPDADELPGGSDERD